MDELILGTVIVVSAVLVAFRMRMAALERRLDTLSRLDAKLDALLKHAGIRFDPYGDVPAAVSAALARGEKIEAIKHYRAATGSGLREAKEFVEEVQRRKGAR
jgi:ribosomal protein L7/L12